jgi:hypothetical protein
MRKLFPGDRLIYLDFCDFKINMGLFLIERPYLYGIFDIDKDMYANPPKGWTSADLNASRIAFCDFLLHNFRKFVIYRPARLFPSGVDEYEQVMQNVMVEYMVTSTPFREIVENELSSHANDSKSQRRITNLLGVVGCRLPIFEKYKAGQITEAEYREARKKKHKVVCKR